MPAAGIFPAAVTAMAAAFRKIVNDKIFLFDFQDKSVIIKIKISTAERAQ